MKTTSRASSLPRCRSSRSSAPASCASRRSRCGRRSGTPCARPELRRKVHLWQIGLGEPGTERVLNAAPDGVTVHYIPPVSQREAIGFMLGADLLLVEEYGNSWPSKTLQYLRAGRPILAFVPRDGMIREVLETVPVAHVMVHDEIEHAGRVIAELAAQPRLRAGVPPAAVAAYSRREIARRYAALLDEVSADREPTGAARPPSVPAPS